MVVVLRSELAAAIAEALCRSVRAAAVCALARTRDLDVFLRATEAPPDSRHAFDGSMQL